MVCIDAAYGSYRPLVGRNAQRIGASVPVYRQGSSASPHLKADWLPHAGEANIRAVVHNSASEYGVGAISVINRYYGRDDIPVGAYKGHIGKKNTHYHSPWGFYRVPPAEPWQVHQCSRKRPAECSAAGQNAGLQGILEHSRVLGYRREPLRETGPS